VGGVMRMQECGARLEKEGKVLSLYHIVARPGSSDRQT
jgi:hypothetical protein